jgi:hypothetical protein
MAKARSGRRTLDSYTVKSINKIIRGNFDSLLNTSLSLNFISPEKEYNNFSLEKESVVMMDKL